MKLSRYSKSIVAFFGAAATWAAAALDDNKVSNGEWAGLVAAVIGVFAVYQVRNSDAAEDGQAGHGDWVFAAVVALVVVAALVLFGVIEPLR